MKTITPFPLQHFIKQPFSRFISKVVLVLSLIYNPLASAVDNITVNATASNGTLIDFQQLEHTDPLNTYIDTELEYIEDGFKIEGHVFVVPDEPASLSTFGTLHQSYTGSTAMSIVGLFPSFSLNKIDESNFNLISIDLNELSSQTFYFKVTFSRDGGYSQTFTLDGNPSTTETFFFDAEFLGSKHVNWRGTEPQTRLQFDNILIDATIPTASTYSLSNNQWYQISLPYDPGTNTARELFGDDSLGDYDTDWVLFHYDSATNAYIKLALTDTLSQGIGYWIIQNTGSKKAIDMPIASTPTFGPIPPMLMQSSCAFARSCFVIPLNTNMGTTSWNMIGYPFAMNGLLNDDVRVVPETNADILDYTLDGAEALGIVHNQLWNYNGSGYNLINTSDGNLEPWLGYWLATMNNAHIYSPYLWIPTPRPPVRQY